MESEFRSEFISTFCSCLMQNEKADCPQGIKTMINPAFIYHRD